MMWIRSVSSTPGNSGMRTSRASGQTRTADLEIARATQNTRGEYYFSAVQNLINLFEESGRMEHETMLLATFVRARRLLDTIPSGFPVPEIGLDPDGEVAFDWIRHDRTMVSVSIGPEGDPSYAAGLLDGTAYGFIRWTNSFPGALTDLLRRLYHPEAAG